jgi:hypothetical protein
LQLKNLRHASQDSKVWQRRQFHMVARTSCMQNYLAFRALLSISYRCNSRRDSPSCVNFFRRKHATRRDKMGVMRVRAKDLCHQALIVHVVIVHCIQWGQKVFRHFWRCFFFSSSSGAPQLRQQIATNVSSLSHVFLLPTKKGRNNPAPTESL